MPKIDPNTYYSSSNAGRAILNASERLKTTSGASQSTDNGEILSRYSNVVEIKEAGLSQQYNELTRSEIALGYYNFNIENTKSTLNKQLAKIKQVNDIMVQFQCDCANFSGQINTPEVTAQKNQMINNTLLQIQGLLNSCDSEGNYLFGGANNSIMPCGDILNISNLNAQGNVTKNYTKAVPINESIKVSDIHQVYTGIDAGNEIFQYAIGAINQYKNGNPIGSETYAKKAIDLADQAIYTKQNYVNIIDEAKTYNDRVATENKLKFIDVYTKDPVEIHEEYRNAYEVYRAVILSIQQRSRAFEDLVQMYNRI